MKRVLYVIGEPGVGKTALVRWLLRAASERHTNHAGGRAWTYTEPPAPKWTAAGITFAAGYYKGEAFDGADTIPYNGARAALEHWHTHIAPHAELTILDGARFSTRTSLANLRGYGAQVLGVHLVAPLEAIERRAKRAEKAGTALQNPAWIKGAATGARNFAALIGARDLDATISPLGLFGQVANILGETA